MLMLFKLIKSVLFVFISSVAIYYFLIRDNTFDQTSSTVSGSVDHENSANFIEYNFKIPSGKVSLKAEKARLKSVSEISLVNIDATYVSKGKTSRIRAKSCIFDGSEKKVYLNKNVVLESEDMIIKTEDCVIDIKNHTAEGSSEVFAEQSGVKIKADGFIVKKDGSIALKHAKIIKGGV